MPASKEGGGQVGSQWQTSRQSSADAGWAGNQQRPADRQVPLGSQRRMGDVEGKGGDQGGSRMEGARCQRVMREASRQSVNNKCVIWRI